MIHRAIVVVSYVMITLCTFLLLGVKHLQAVTETCSNVATTFNATLPTSVYKGQAFTVSNINSQPANSYGYTITSSTLSLSATNATPATYSMTNSSTVPSPTTGAVTYTANYPNWSLTATGNTGSQITIVLTQATATIVGVGQLICPLTATLGTIGIVAAPQAPSAATTGTNNKPTAASSSSTTTSITAAPASQGAISPIAVAQPTPKTSAQATTMPANTVKVSTGLVKGTKTPGNKKLYIPIVGFSILVATGATAFLTWRVIRKRKIPLYPDTPALIGPSPPKPANSSMPPNAQPAPIVFEPQDLIPKF
ncbi:MAG: hypothetical protein WCJ24_01210 [Candidatus Saccharibacteria bacterium]